MGHSQDAGHDQEHAKRRLYTTSHRSTVSDEEPHMMCFNKRVLGGLAIVALGTLVVAPEFVGRVIPLLLVLACPLSMVLMMRGMSGGKHSCSTDGGARTATGAQGEAASTPLDAEVRELREEVNRLRAEAALREAMPPSVGAPPLEPSLSDEAEHRHRGA